MGGRFFAFAALALVASACGQLHGGRDRSRGPGGHITFLQLASGGPAQEKQPSGGDLLKEQLASVEASQNEVNGLLTNFKKGIANEQAYEVAEAEKAKKLAMGRNYVNTRMERLRKMAQVRETTKRVEIDRCLSMIRGGADRVYFELSRLIASAPTEQRCAVLKAFSFPDLKKHGFGESFALKYKLINAPATDGSEVLFFTAVKPALMRCMCESKPQAVEKPFKVRYPACWAHHGALLCLVPANLACYLC